MLASAGDGAADRLHDLRMAGADALSELESNARYAWIDGLLAQAIDQPSRLEGRRSDRADRILAHRLFGVAIFVLVNVLVFEAIYTWSGPLMDGIDALFAACGDRAAALIPPGALQSLVVDGLIAGVGGVLIFLPQIAILFFFIALLEDSGYMARAALLMDRLLTRVGLSGTAFMPLLSSFACAVPGIMAARTIEDRRDRFATILVAPLMSCSARLPVYVLFIGAFVPGPLAVGWGHWLAGADPIGVLLPRRARRHPSGLVAQADLAQGRSSAFSAGVAFVQDARPAHGAVARVP